MKPFFTTVFFIAILVVSTIAAQPDAAALRKKYPDANTVLLNDTEYIRYNPDGSSVSTDTFSYIILTRKGRDDLRQLSFSFHTNYEKISIPALSITKANGKTITLDAAKLAVTSIDHSQMSARIYDPNSKKLSVTIPNLEIGDILSITVKDECFKSRIPGQWSGFAVLQSSSPVLNYTYVVDAPASRPLRSIAVKDEVKGSLKYSKTEKDGRIIYRWQASNVPQLIPEPGMPPLYRCAMRVLTSTAKNWSEIASWYADLCAPRLAAVTPEMKAFVKKTIAGKKSDMEKIYTLFQYVSQRIRYTGITDEETAPGYEPHDVSRTFERGHGVCRDKAALLTALLKLAGIDAYPVLFMSGYPKDDDVPNIYFNHAIVGVKGKDGKDILMDPTFETTTELFPAYLGNCSYLVATKAPTTLKRSPTAPAENNLLAISNEATVSGTALNGKITMDLKGIHDQMYRATFSEWTPEDIRRYFAGALRDIIPGAELKNYTVTPKNIRDMAQPLKIVLEYSAPEYISETAALTPLVLPEFAARFGTIRNLYNALKLEKRRFPLEALPRAVSEKFTLKLSPQITLKSLPAKVDLSIPDVLRLSREVTAKGTVISGKNFFAIDTAEFSPADYLKAKAALARFETANKTLPLAQIAPLPQKKSYSAKDYPGADSLVISDVREIKILSPSSWEDVRTVTRKIFTYGGAVQHSTVKIPYHPLMEDVIVSGEFITPAGKKHILSAKEINRLDAPWASAARRYPAGKILTAAFPGVEPGSTVTYTITRKVKDKPFFYVQMYARTLEPALLRKLSVASGKQMNLSTYVLPADFRLSVKGDTYSVSAIDQPRIIPEASTPLPEKYIPTAKLYSISPGKFAQKLHAALQKKIIVTPEISKLAKKLATVPAIHKFVTENIVEAGPDLNEAPWSIFSSPEETLKSGVGNSADRAILYAALCKALNIKYELLAVASTPGSDQDKYAFRDYSDISRIILKVEGNYVLNDSSRYADAVRLYSIDKTILRLADGKFGLPRPEKLPAHSRSIAVRIKINTDKSADITISESFSGIYKELAKRKLMTSTPTELKQYFQAKCAAIAQSAVLVKHNFETGKNVCFNYTLKIPDFAVKHGGKFYTFELPLFKLLADELRLSGEKRTLPYQRRFGEFVSLDYHITLPGNLEFSSGNANIAGFAVAASSTLPYGTWFGVTGNLRSKQDLHLDYSLILPFETLQPREYPGLIKLNKLLNTPSQRQIILEERKK